MTLQMTPHIGTKQLLAVAMTRGEYNAYRDWTLPADEDPADEGFLVEYVDGSAGNDPRHIGYISWSPREVFEAAYRSSGAMNFGHAVELLKQGQRVARSGWNGKNMWLMLMSGGDSTLPDGAEFEARPFIVMKSVDDQIVPWTCSQSDALADDWMIVVVARPAETVAQAA